MQRFTPMLAYADAAAALEFLTRAFGFEVRFRMDLPDGSVEIHVEGDRESVSRMEHKIRRGPPAARVEHVSVTDDDPTGRADGFSVR